MSAPTIEAAIDALYTGDALKAYTGLDGIDTQLVYQRDDDGYSVMLWRHRPARRTTEYASAPIRFNRYTEPGEMVRAVESAVKLAATMLVRILDLERGPYA